MIYIIYHLKNLLFFKNNNNKMDPFNEILKKIEENTGGLTLDLSHHEIGEEKTILLGKALKKTIL